MKAILCIFVVLAAWHRPAAAITGYSNTLSSTASSATSVKSTYTFTPTSGSATQFNKIEITNQPFTAASSQLSATCTNCVTAPRFELGKAASTADQTATITFTTSTPLTAESIILTFPAAGHVTTLASNKCAITSPTGKTTTSVMAAGPPHTITITLAASNTVPAGQVTVTCGGMTLAAKAAAVAASGLSITTTKDTVAAKVALPAVGAVTVTAVAHSSFTASFFSNTVTVQSSVPVWAQSAAPSVACIVETFTNPSTQGATANVGIATKLDASAVESASDLAFPAITAGGGGNIPATTTAASKSSAASSSLSIAFTLTVAFVLFP